MNFNRFIFILSFSIIVLNGMGQKADIQNPPSQKKQIKYLDFRFENGAMLSNDTELGDQIVNSSYYNGVDIRLGFRRSDPNDIYSNVYRRPYLGLGFYSSTFHNEDIGEPNALYFFLNFPFAFEGNKKFTFSYSGAFGLTYNLNPFDSIDNPANVFIGSYRNVYVHLGVVVNYKFNETWAVNGTLGFKHFSNGSFKLPNSGINLVPVTLGLSYRLSKQQVHHQRMPIPEYIKHGLINISFLAGSKNYEVGGGNHLKMGLGVNCLKQVNYKYRIGLGFDLFYAADADLRSSSNASNFSKSYSYALVGSWEWVLTKKLYVPIGLAFYLHRNVENGEINAYYERVGMRYRFFDHYFAGLTIKAHGGVADIFEWTLGYTIHHDSNTY